MSKPTMPKEGLDLDLAAIVRELQAEASYAHGHAARTLVRGDDLRVVLIAVRSGSGLARHHAASSATVQTILGRVRMHLPKRTVELAAGQMLAMPPNLEHDVEAIGDSAILLTFGWPVASAGDSDADGG